MEILERLRQRRVKLEKASRDIRGKVRFNTVDLNYALDAKIGCVDGGLVVKSLQGIDIIFARAVGVVYNYKNGKLVSVDYFPSAYVEPDMIYSDDSREESSKLSSIFRLEKEIGLANHMLDSVDYLLLDGSLFPQPGDKPSGVLLERYEQLVESYEELMGKAIEKEVGLIGVVEDSRGKRFARSLGLDFVDAVLLGMSMKYGEYTDPISYTDDPEHHFILKDFDRSLVDRVKVSYIKCAPEDVSLRIEFLNNKPLQDVANLIFSLSFGSSDYGYPSIILEADARAKIREEEILHWYNLISSIGGETTIARRNRRLI